MLQSEGLPAPMMQTVAVARRVTLRLEFQDPRPKQMLNNT